MRKFDYLDPKLSYLQYIEIVKVYSDNVIRVDGERDGEHYLGKLNFSAAVGCKPKDEDEAILSSLQSLSKRINAVINKLEEFEGLRPLDFKITIKVLALAEKVKEKIERIIALPVANVAAAESFVLNVEERSNDIFRTVTAISETEKQLKARLEELRGPKINFEQLKELIDKMKKLFQEFPNHAIGFFTSRWEEEVRKISGLSRGNFGKFVGNLNRRIEKEQDLCEQLRKVYITLQAAYKTPNTALAVIESFFVTCPLQKLSEKLEEFISKYANPQSLNHLNTSVSAVLDFAKSTQERLQLMQQFNVQIANSAVDLLISAMDSAIVMENATIPDRKWLCCLS